MATLNLIIQSGPDDAFEDDGGGSFSSTGATILVLNNTIAGVRGNGGFRFVNVTIPQGATITSAIFQAYVTSNDDPDNLTIRGEAIDDSPNYVTNADVTSRALTTASVAWPGINLGTNAYLSSPDISAVVQEIVDRAGWAAGNALSIILKGRAGGSTGLAVHAFENPAFPANPAKLIINFEVAPPTHLRYFGGGNMLHLETNAGAPPQISNDYGVSWSAGAQPTGGGAGPYTRCKGARMDSEGVRVWTLWTNSAETQAAICYSLDFGATSVVSLEVAGATTFMTDIACHPAETGRIAVVGAIAGDSKVWVTVDRGANWTARTGPAIGNAIGYQPIEAGASAYITWTPYGRLLISTGGRLATADGDLYYSDDLGVNWTKATVPSPAPNRNWNVQLFRVGGFGPYFMLYGDEATGAALSALLRSDNHGVSWTNVLTPNTSENFAGLEYDPLSDTLLLSTATHVYGLSPSGSDDIANWSDMTANFYSIAVNEYVFQPLAFVGDPASA